MAHTSPVSYRIFIEKAIIHTRNLHKTQKNLYILPKLPDFMPGDSIKNAARHILPSRVFRKEKIKCIVKHEASETDRGIPLQIQQREVEAIHRAVAV